LALAVASVAPLADLWFCVAPPWPDHEQLVFAVLPFPVGVFVAAGPFFLSLSRAPQDRCLRILLVSLTLTAIGYVVAYCLLIHYLPDRAHREVGGWAYTERAEIIREMNPGITLEGILKRSDNQMQSVFTPLSLRSARAALLLGWFGLALEGSLLLALLLVVHVRYGGSVEARAQALTAAVDDQLRRHLQGLADKLGQPTDARLVVEGMMPWCLALLSRVYALHGEERPSDNLASCVEDLDKRNLVNRGVRTMLHKIRIFANQAHHDLDEWRQLSVERQHRVAKSVVEDALWILEWFYCECPQNPHKLPTIYTG
jgi:hypothetical protein